MGKANRVRVFFKIVPGINKWRYFSDLSCYIFWGDDVDPVIALLFQSIKQILTNQFRPIDFN
jgi:hypothetical protein